MTALQSLQNGDLKGTLQKLQAEVVANPEDPKHRIFLFQLLSVLGQWDRALTQLNVVRELGPEALSLAQTYQETLNCEALRSSVFSGQRAPLIFGEPEPWMGMMLEALKMDCQGQPSEALSLRELALEQAPTTAGKLATVSPSKEASQASAQAGASDISEVVSFAWVADADSRIGPSLEAIIHGRYFWVPFQRIDTMLLEKASDLRDLVWLPARFKWVNGGEAVGFVPTRYVGSERSDDDHIRLGWKTVWEEASPGTYVGLGQRVLATDVEEYSLTKIARIEFEVESA